MITTRKSHAYSEYALSSFFQHTQFGKGDEFILIDNDACVEAEFSQYPLSVLRNESPKGFAENANQAVKLALEKNSDLFLLNNDLIFTEGWHLPLDLEDRAIISPLSNREVQYACSVVVPKTQHITKLFVSEMVMTLESYLQNRHAFSAIAEAHRQKSEGVLDVFVLPFYCVKIPHVVLENVGYFDQSFGVAGAEDYDYALRAQLAGFGVRFALPSLILHFYGKSSWDAGESKAERSSREQHFMQIFKDKWGEDLFQLIFLEKDSILDEHDLRQHVLTKRSWEVVEKLKGGRKIRVKL